MLRYAQESTLLDALDAGDLRTIYRCIKVGGQRLDTIRINGRPLLVDCVLWDRQKRFLTAMAFKKFLKISEPFWDKGHFSIMDYAISYDFPYLHILLQNGANPVCGHFARSVKHEHFFEKCCLLLSVGLDPKNARPCGKVRREVHRWLQGLDSAKIVLHQIFDNEVLELEIQAFVYNEGLLRKIL